MPTNASALIEPESLMSQLDDSHCVVLDASWVMPSDPRNPYQLYLKEHIPGARFFDIDLICDENSPLPHMLPSPDAFTDAVTAFGIGSGHHVVVYDLHGMMSAARVWWMFRVFGHNDVRVLNGGLPRWKQLGLPLESGSPRITPPSEPFVARLQPHLLATQADILADLNNPNALILDARPSERYNGQVPEPRPGLRQGHIPHSLNVPWNSLMSDSGHFDPERLKEQVDGARWQTALPLVCSCGSGVTACVLALALHELGRADARVYDGSWAEWGANPALPLVMET